MSCPAGSRASSIFAAPALAGLVLAVGSEATVFALVGAVACVGAVLVAPLRGSVGAVRQRAADEDSEFRRIALVRAP